jgi:hypothetical protein
MNDKSICYKYTEDWIVMAFAKDPITVDNPFEPSELVL